MPQIVEQHRPRQPIFFNYNKRLPRYVPVMNELTEFAAQGMEWPVEMPEHGTDLTVATEIKPASVTFAKCSDRKIIEKVAIPVWFKPSPWALKAWEHKQE